jgi:hypothetical protein
MSEENRKLLEVVLSWIQDGCPTDEQDAAEGTIQYILAE